MAEKFDFEQYKKQAVEDLLSGRKEISGPDGVLAPLLKQFLEAALDAELGEHAGPVCLLPALLHGRERAEAQQ